MYRDHLPVLGEQNVSRIGPCNLQIGDQVNVDTYNHRASKATIF